MKLHTSCFSVHRLLRASALISAFAIIPSLHAQTTYTWGNPSGTSVITAAGNWTPGGGPPIGGDTARWDGTVSGNLSLTHSGTFGGSSGDNGVNLDITSGQTSSLNINSSAAVFRTGSITIASGAGSFSMGDGSGSGPRMLLQGATGTTHTFTNNSANTAIFRSDSTIENTGSNNEHLLFTGSGNWQVDGTIIPAGAATSNLTKQGTGTLTLNGVNTYTGITSIEAGTLAGIGSITGAATVTSGKLAPGTDGTVGTLTFNSTLDLSGLTGTGGLKFDLGPVGASDKIALSAGALSIGTGSLNFDDFSFSALSGFGTGVYTLFDTSTTISGTLGPDLTGTINGFNGTLSVLANQDIILTVTSTIPEPSSFAIFAGALALMVTIGGNRRRKVA